MAASDDASSSGYRQSVNEILKKTKKGTNLGRSISQHLGVLAGPITTCAPPTRCRDTEEWSTVFTTRARWRVGALVDRERSSDDSEAKASDMSLGKSNESPLEKSRGLSTRVEFEEVGESSKEGADDKEVELSDEGDGALEGSGFDTGCGDDWECDETNGAGFVAGGVGMLEVTEGLPCVANARTTAS